MASVPKSTGADVGKLVGELADDIRDAGLRIQESDTPSLRRDYVRALLAVVEGLTYAFKQWALEIGDLRRVAFDPEEHSLLRDEAYNVANNGAIKRRSKFLPTAANVRFMVRCMAKAMGRSYFLEVEGDGWGALKKTIAVRNRLMHPKAAGDIQVSDEEFATACKAAPFILNVFRELGQVSGESVEEFVERVRKDPRVLKPRY